MRNLRTVLTAAAVVSGVIAIGVGSARVPVAAAGAPLQTPATSGGDRARLLGTYRLVTTEVKDAAGKWTLTPGFNSTGYITYSDSGYMGVHIMPKDRPKFAAAQPTAEEAQAALRGYTAYFGPFIMNEKDQIVTHHRIGTLSPGGDPDFKRYYDFVGNRLILTPVPATGGKEEATNHLIWERQPDAPLSAEAKKFAGVSQLLYTDRYTEKDGKIVARGERNDTRAGSWIIYTPTGHMMVHLMDKAGRLTSAGRGAPPDRAIATYRSYAGYFGRFAVHDSENPRSVVHNQEGTINPGKETDAKLLYEFNGNVLRLAEPQTTANGETAGELQYWERLPSLK